MMRRQGGVLLLGALTLGAMSCHGDGGTGGRVGRTVADSVFACRGPTGGKLDPAASAAPSAARAKDIVHQAGASSGFVDNDGSTVNKLLGGADAVPLPKPAMPSPVPRPLGTLMRRTGVVRAMVSPIPSLL